MCRMTASSPSLSARPARDRRRSARWVVDCRGTSTTTRTCVQATSRPDTTHRTGWSSDGGGVVSVVTQRGGDSTSWEQKRGVHGKGATRKLLPFASYSGGKRRYEVFLSAA